MHLYQLLIGSKPKGRHTEQHDVYFGFANELKDMVPALKKFWPEAADNMHIDAYMRVLTVDDYAVSIVPKAETVENEVQLFFINLGGYKPNEFNEYHYPFLVAAKTKTEAMQIAKQTAFYKHVGFAGAPSHIDDKYGVDVDDAYAIEEVLSAEDKATFAIKLTKLTEPATASTMSLGYHILSKIEKGIYETD
jgi:Domain of Unknown Function (DUF1543)